MVAQCFLPRFGIAPTGARNKLLIAPFSASFDIGKKHCGVLPNVIGYVRTTTHNKITIGEVLWHEKK
ncbi:MAG: hypothetical protein QHH13_06410 [Melioribacter sp.]|nr:hypothetical protein [Melioribacter sp.]